MDDEDKLDKFLEENPDNIEKIKKLLGVKDNLSKTRLRFIYSWRHDYGFTWEMIEIACKKIGPRSHSFKIVDSKLQDWLMYKLVTPKQLDEFQKAEAEKWAQEWKRKYNNPKRVYTREKKHEPYCYYQGEKELLPCPFCGGTNIGIKAQHSTKTEVYYILAVCGTCGANTKATQDFTGLIPSDPNFWESDSAKEAVRLWNMRFKG